MLRPLLVAKSVDVAPDLTNFILHCAKPTVSLEYIQRPFGLFIVEALGVFDPRNVTPLLIRL
ncbi:hypothetical protein BCC0238_003123 [Burkholderia gladioli]